MTEEAIIAQTRNRLDRAYRNGELSLRDYNRGLDAIRDLERFTSNKQKENRNAYSRAETRQ